MAVSFFIIWSNDIGLLAIMLVWDNTRTEYRIVMGTFIAKEFGGIIEMGLREMNCEVWMWMDGSQVRVE
jgi:hypothetical protein